MINRRKLIEKGFSYRKQQYQVNRFEKNKLDLLMKGINENTKVLEVGCGYGFFSQLLLRKTKKVWATDIVWGIAKEPLSKGVDFKKMKKGKLPFKNDFFDYLISTDVIEHVESDGEFLEECKRVLKKNGRVIVMTPNRYRLSFWLKTLILKKPRFPNTKRVDPVLGVDQHLREYDKKELKAIFDKKDWRKLSIRGYGMGGGSQISLSIVLPRGFDFCCNYWLAIAQKFSHALGKSEKKS